MKKIIISSLLVLTFNAFAEDEKLKYAVALQKLSGVKQQIDSIEDTPVKGIKELIVKTEKGSQIYYISEDGKYIFYGSLVSVDDRHNLTESKTSAIRKDLLSGIKSDEKINFYPEEMTDHVTVFTDIDCGYCRKLHEEMDQYHELGIGVSYLFYPRAGLQSLSFDKAVTVWCSDDQKKAMTQAKAGKEQDPKICNNPIENHYDKAISAGIDRLGTPTIVFGDGSVVRGYVAPLQLKRRLALKKP